MVTTIGQPGTAPLLERVYYWVLVEHFPSFHLSTANTRGSMLRGSPIYRYCQRPGKNLEKLKRDPTWAWARAGRVLCPRNSRSFACEIEDSGWIGGCQLHQCWSALVLSCREWVFLTFLSALALTLWSRALVLPRWAACVMAVDQLWQMDIGLLCDSR